MKKWKFLAAASLTLMLAACGSDEEVQDRDGASVGRYSLAQYDC